jgi:ribosomal protein S18 acetylase RimI-like enzyme
MRIATLDDLGPVVATLTESFFGDPLMTWAFPEPSVRAQRLSTLWRYMAEFVYLPGGVCTTTEDHSAVALWRDPSNLRSEEFRETRGEEFYEAMCGDLDRISAMGRVMAQHHPVDPHWYLLAVGVLPEKQGRGLGGDLLNFTLNEVLPAQMPAYLEATSLRSRTLYHRLGFEELSEFGAQDSPPLWGMWLADSNCTAANTLKD